MKKDKINIFTHEFYPKRGGIATFIEGMALAAYYNNYNVTLYSPFYRLSGINCKKIINKYPFNINGMMFHNGKQNLLCIIITLIYIIKNYKKIKNSIIYLPEPGPIKLFLYLQFFKIFSLKNIVITLHGSEVNMFNSFFLTKWLFQKFLMNINKITVLSEYTKNNILKIVPLLPKNKIVKTPGALQFNFNNDQKDILYNEKKLNFNNSFILLTVARIHPRKGHDQVIIAISKLNKQLKKRIIYNIVGPIVDNKYKEYLLKLINKYQLNINFTNEVSDQRLKDMYKNADLFILASRKYKNSIEGFGLVFLEAFSAGLPVIATNTGGVSDIVKNNKNGILVDEDSIIQIKNAIETMMTNKKQYEFLSKNVKKYLQNNTWENNVKVAFS